MSTICDASDLAYRLAAAGPPTPERLTTVAQELAFQRADAERRARAEYHGELLDAILNRTPHEVGYIHARGAGMIVAGAAIVINLDETDYFGNALPAVEVARRKRAATIEAQRLARTLLADPLDADDVAMFLEGMELEVGNRHEGDSDVSPAVYHEVERIVNGWAAAA